MADKKSPKAIDAVQPGDTPPAPTSRPIIVSNHSYMKADPMLSSESGEEKPSNEPSAEPKEEVPEQDVTPKSANIVASNEGKKLTPSAAVEEAAQSEPEAPKPDAPEEKPKAPAPDDKPMEQPWDTEEKADESSEVVDEEDASLSPEEEANAAHEAELERHIEAGTYAVPINRVNRQHQRVVLIVLLLALLLLIVLDGLLDMGILKVSGVPHTNFFSQ